MDRDLDRRDRRLSLERLRLRRVLDDFVLLGGVLDFDLDCFRFEDLDFLGGVLDFDLDEDRDSDLFLRRRSLERDLLVNHV